MLPAAAAESLQLHCWWRWLSKVFHPNSVIGVHLCAASASVGVAASASAAASAAAASAVGPMLQLCLTAAAARKSRAFQSVHVAIS